MQTFTLRPESEILPEQIFLQRRAVEIEKGMGVVAAQGGAALTQPLDALDRARELTYDMAKQVRIRPLPEAISAQLAWLDRAEARLALVDGEPKLDLNRIALDRRLLDDLQRAWAAERN